MKRVNHVWHGSLHHTHRVDEDRSSSDLFIPTREGRCGKDLGTCHTEPGTLAECTLSSAGVHVTVSHPCLGPIVYPFRSVPVPVCTSQFRHVPVYLFVPVPFCTSPVLYQSRSVPVPFCTSPSVYQPFLSCHCHVHFLYQSRSVPVPVCSSQFRHILVQLMYQSYCVPASSVIPLSNICTSLTVYQPVPSYPCPTYVPVLLCTSQFRHIPVHLLYQSRSVYTRHVVSQYQCEDRD